MKSGNDRSMHGFSRNGRRLSVIVCFILFFQGCSALRGHPDFPPEDRPAEASLFFTAMDAAVEREAVGDAAAFRLSGFPYLRTDRFLAAMAARIETDDQRETWLNAMRQLDIVGRQKEIRNLPDHAVNDLADRFGVIGREGLIDLTAVRGDRLLKTDSSVSGFVAAVADAVRCNSEYSNFLRVAGLYPIAALPVTALTHKAQREFRGWHRTPPEALPVRGVLTDYVPPSFFAEETGDILFDRDALGRIILAPEQTTQLVERFAPVLRQDVADDADRPGRMVWQGDRVSVDIENPTAYVYLTHAFYRDVPAIQINYVFWYRARTGPDAPLIERGRLDGMTVRVSLAPDGRAFMATVMNNCGCYQQSFPHPDFVSGVAPQPLEIDAFAPTDLPGDIPPMRLSLRINSGWHQVQRVVSGPTPDEGIVYSIRPYSDLESLPRESGGAESIFTPDGIVKGSGRIEPYILFSMGIPDVGAMRQRGHHATRLVGREHFDDPQVFNRNFIFREEETAP